MILRVVMVGALSLSGGAALVAAGPAAEPGRYLATAATGEGIPQPGSIRTYPVESGGRTIVVPEGMVYIPAGRCTLGTGAAATTVTLDAYCIGKFEVTNVEYKAFLDATGAGRAPRYWTGRKYPDGKANHPVLDVSLTDALAYCAWVSRQTGWNIAIPTAAQWEKAARGPRGTLYPWGDSLEASYDRVTGRLTSKCNYNGVIAAALLREHAGDPAAYNHEKSARRGTTTTVAQIAAYDASGRATPFAVDASGAVSGWVNHATYTGFIYTDVFTRLMNAGGNTSPVGAFPEGRSGYGCHDMAGNAYEWTATLGVATNGAEKGKTVNEVRGGSWYANGHSCRSVSTGEGRAAAGAYTTVGFRIVMIPRAGASPAADGPSGAR